MRLTQRNRNKIAAILQTTFQNAFFYKTLYMLIGISLKSVPQGPINNNSSLVKVMACCLIGDQPSLESVTQSTDINVSRSQRDILRIFSQRI